MVPMGDRVAADAAGCALRVVVGWCLVLTGLLVPAPSGAVEPVRVMIVGDSVTQGSSGDWTWRYRLWQHFQAAGVAVDFVGPREDLFDNVNGVHGSMDYLEPDFDRDHAARWGQSLEVQDFRITDLVNEFEPDVVVEMLGVNDLPWGGAEPATVANRLREFAADARAADPSVGLVLARAPQTWGTGVPEFNELVDDVAAEWDDPDARAVSAAPDEGFRHYDDTWDPAHANAHGEELIAGAIADALASLGIGPLAIRPVDEHPLGPRVAPTLAVAPGDHRAVLSWTGPPGATGQYVWVSDRTVGEEWRRLPYSVSGGTWTDEGLDNGHTYAFRLQPVKGYWAAADDIRSNVSTVTPQPPA